MEMSQARAWANCNALGRLIGSGLSPPAVIGGVNTIGGGFSAFASGWGAAKGSWAAANEGLTPAVASPIPKQNPNLRTVVALVIPAPPCALGGEHDASPETAPAPLFVG